MRYMYSIFIVILFTLEGRGQSIEPSGSSTASLSFEDAVRRTLAQNPEVKGLEAEIQARTGLLIQAGKWVNPELTVTLEDFAGNGIFDGFERSQTTLQLSQRIEWGGKRAARTGVAEAAKDAAMHGFDLKRSEVLTRLAKAYVEVWRNQKNLEVWQEVANLANEVSNTAILRVEAGKIAAIESTRTKAALSLAKIELQRATAQAATSRKILASFWGEQTTEFSVSEDLKQLLPPTSIQSIDKQIQQNAELKQQAALVQEREAALKLQKSHKVPDLNLSGGYRHLQEFDTGTFVAQVSIPLPLLNRNEGNIHHAQYELVKAAEEKKAIEIRLKTSLGEAYSTFEISASEVKALNTEVMPAAEEAFVAVSEGYRLGKFNYLEILDAQRTLFEARRQNIRALADYHKAAADLLFLTGKPIGSQYLDMRTASPEEK